MYNKSFSTWFAGEVVRVVSKVVAFGIHPGTLSLHRTSGVEVVPYIPEVDSARMMHVRCLAIVDRSGRW